MSFRLLGSDQKIESGFERDRESWLNLLSEDQMEQENTRQSAVELIDQTVNEFLTRLKNKEMKLTVSDLLRLLELRNQLARDEVREVRVKWVESSPEVFAINS